MFQFQGSATFPCSLKILENLCFFQLFLEYSNGRLALNKLMIKQINNSNTQIQKKITSTVFKKGFSLSFT